MRRYAPLSKGFHTLPLNLQRRRKLSARGNWVDSQPGATRLEGNFRRECPAMDWATQL
ncbi:hypothetical protein EMIT043CA1_120104 [Pseudomonas brassicacearum]